MSFCDVVTKNGQATEKLHADAVVTPQNLKTVLFVPDKINSIEQRMSGQA